MNMLWPNTIINRFTFKYTKANKRRVWDALFDLSVLRKKQRQNFEHYVATDGITASVLFRKNKLQYFAKHKLEEMKDFNDGVIETIRNNYENNLYDRIGGIDLNARCPIACVITEPNHDDRETNILLTNDTYHRQLRFNEYTTKLAKILKKFTAFEKSELALHRPHYPSSTSIHVSTYTNHNLKLFTGGFEAYGNKKYAHEKFKFYQKRQAQMMKIVHKLTNNQKTLLFVSPSPIHARSRIKGYRRTPLMLVQ